MAKEFNDILETKKAKKAAKEKLLKEQQEAAKKKPTKNKRGMFKALQDWTG